MQSKKNTDMNIKNYRLNGFLRGQFLNSKDKTRGIALNIKKVI